VIDINVRARWPPPQAALKHMKNGGRIIMTGSAVAERVSTPGLVAYAATKELKMFTQALCQRGSEAGASRSNNVQPGPTDTDLNPGRAIGRCLRRPPQRSTATGVLRKSPRWWRSWPVPSPLHHRPI